MIPGVFNPVLLNGGKHPTLFATAVFAGDAQGTSHAITLPSGIKAGDEILCYFNAVGGGSITVPSGYTALQNDTSLQGLFHKVASGTEGGTTLTVNTASNTTYSSMVVAVVRGAALGIKSAIATNTSGASITPPALTPGWGAQPTLWMLFTRNGTGSAGVHVTSSPSGYTKQQDEDAGGCTSSLHTKSNAAAAETPGSVTYSSAGSVGAITAAA